MFRFLVSGLSYPVCPPAILWRVRSVVIDAINTVFVAGPWTHIQQEPMKASHSNPSLAHGDSFTTIAVPESILSIGASLNHSTPNAMLCRSRHSVSLWGLAEGFCSTLVTSLRFAALNVWQARVPCFEAFRTGYFNVSHRLASSCTAQPRFPNEHHPVLDFIPGEVNSLFRHIGSLVTGLLRDGHWLQPRGRFAISTADSFQTP